MAWITNSLVELLASGRPFNCHRHLINLDSHNF